MTPDLSQAVWRKSNRSNGQGGNCVEVAQVDTARAVRDSKNQAGPVLAFGDQDWMAFLTEVKASS